MPRGKSLSTQAVMDRAFELARARGIDSITYNGLARELDIRPQSMYRYVPDIKALRVALLGGFLNELVDKISASTAALSPKDALRTFAVTLYDECHVHPYYYEAFELMHRYGLVSELQPALTRLVNLIQQPLSEIKSEPNEVMRYTQLIMAVILGYAQMAKTAFIVESLADNRDSYVCSIEDFIENMIG